MVFQLRCLAKETNRKKAQMLADEYEKSSRTKRTLKQAQAVLDKLDEEFSGNRIIRATFRTYLETCLEAKETATSPATMAFYRKSLAKFVEFLGPRADDPISGRSDSFGTGGGESARLGMRDGASTATEWAFSSPRCL